MKKITVKFDANFEMSGTTSNEEMVLFFQNTPVEDLVRETEKSFKEDIPELTDVKVSNYYIEIGEEIVDESADSKQE